MTLSISGRIHEAHRCYWTYPSSSGVPYQSVRKECLTSRNPHWKVTSFYMLPRRTMTLEVNASTPGFGAKPKKKTTKKLDRMPQRNEEKDPIVKAKKILAKKEQILQKEEAGVVDDAPSILVKEEERFQDPLNEELFEQKLAEVKRAAAERKTLAEQKKYGPIDYDAPPPSTLNSLTGNLGVKIGIGLAVVIFGLIFALGDFLPSGSPTGEKSSLAQKKRFTKEESSKLQAQVQEFEAVLKTSPEDKTALEGAAVSYAELGEYQKAELYLLKIAQKSPNDADVLRLLAEVQNEQGEYDASVSSYRAAIRASGKKKSLPLLQGLTDTLLAAKKPSEAVGELLAARARLNYNFEQIKSNAKEALLPPTLGDGSKPGKVQEDLSKAADLDEQIDPVTLELLLGKVYAAWDGHRADAAAVYDGLIKSYPEDYRGYLAKGVLLKTQNMEGDAERMFIQARYLAPPNSKSIVDIYSGRRTS